MFPSIKTLEYDYDLERSPDFQKHTQIYLDQLDDKQFKFKHRYSNASLNQSEKRNI